MNKIAEIIATYSNELIDIEKIEHNEFRKLKIEHIFKYNSFFYFTKDVISNKREYFKIWAMDIYHQLRLLINHINKNVTLDEFGIEKLSAILILKELNKKEFLIEPGETANTMNFIVQGSMRSYYLDENAQEHTLQLGIEGWWINDLYSYLSRKKSRMYVQALEKTYLIQLPRVQLEKLYIEVPEISNFFRIKIQSAYVALQERVIDSMSNDAYERYDDFRKSYRNIEQRVPQYIIASYLGVTPEFLSYLRKKHS